MQNRPDHPLILSSQRTFQITTNQRLIFKAKLQSILHQIRALMACLSKPGQLFGAVITLEFETICNASSSSAMMFGMCLKQET